MVQRILRKEITTWRVRTVLGYRFGSPLRADLRLLPQRSRIFRVLTPIKLLANSSNYGDDALT